MPKVKKMLPKRAYSSGDAHGEVCSDADDPQPSTSSGQRGRQSEIFEKCSSFLERKYLRKTNLNTYLVLLEEEDRVGGYDCASDKAIDPDFVGGDDDDDDDEEEEEEEEGDESFSSRPKPEKKASVKSVSRGRGRG